MADPAAAGTHPTAEQQIVSIPAHRGEWALVYDGFGPGEERLREALCATGNGYFSSRGAAPEARAGDSHYPGTYAAGVFNRLTVTVEGEQVSNESMVNLPNWLPLAIRVAGGEWFDPARARLLAYRQELDLSRGVLGRRLRFEDEEGRRTILAQRRFVSMADRNVAALETTIEAENWRGEIEVRSAIDGSVENTGVARYAELGSRHLTPARTGELGEDCLWLATETSQSRIGVAVAARTRAVAGGVPLPVERELDERENEVGHLLRFQLKPGSPVTVEKVAVLFTSREPAVAEPGEAARVKIGDLAPFSELLSAHTLRWAQLWQRAGVEIRDGERDSFIVNLHIFHLLQTVSEHTAELDAGVPARGLTGEAYRGHIFWDEAFIFPYLSLRLPELARGLLRYRWHRLDAARRLASEAGLKGAMFPWQSGSDGNEVSQTLHLNPRSGRWLRDNSHLQRHVSAAIAYTFIHHHRVTGDLTFLGTHGAEVVLEVARFWSSIAELDRSRDRWVIRGVMGPDEFHDAYPGAETPGLDNNAYTNVMAAWCLWQALELLEELPQQRGLELRERLGIGAGEIERWRRLSTRMFVPFHDGVISQFEGYEKLEEFDWQGYRARYGDIHRLDRLLEAEGDSPNRYKASKQADVLMLLYLLSAEELTEVMHRLGYDFDPATIPRTVEYYAARTSHGSTLSRLVHSWVLARVDRERSWSLLCEALESDVADVQGGTTSEGIHLGAMAGTVDLLQRGYLGLEPRGDCLVLNPALPPELGAIRLTLHYRDHWSVELEIDEGELRLAVPGSAGRPVEVLLCGKRYRLEPGNTLQRPLG